MSSSYLVLRKNEQKVTLRSFTNFVTHVRGPVVRQKQMLFEKRALSIPAPKSVFVIWEIGCAMLPFCDRRVNLPRKDIAPVWTRSFPISKQPATLGQHLRRRRFEMGMRQAESAVKLGVTCKTLSDWETDRIYPFRQRQNLFCI